MKVCYFGTYEKEYPLNNILIKGLRKNGVEVLECHEAVWEKYQNKTGKFLNIFSLFILLLKTVYAYLKLGFSFFKKCRNIDFYIVGYIGQFDVFFLKFLTFLKRDKAKIIFVPLFSLYDSAVVDRKLFSSRSILGRMLFFSDKYSMRIADVVFLDTNEHGNYISELLGIERSKIRRSFVGADESVFYPLPVEFSKKEDSNFTVLFFGKYIPLHGLENIIGAAKLLENEKNIKFRMIGNGQIHKEIVDMAKKLNLKNIEFINWVPYEELIGEIKNADIVLGIFGGTDKSLRVIPNKIFQAVACKKAVVTGESLAIEELFKDRENIILCKNKNAESLRDAIIVLQHDVKLQTKVASNAYDLFCEKLDTSHIGKDFIDKILAQKI